MTKSIFDHIVRNVASDFITDNEFGTPWLFEKSPVLNYIYRVRDGEKFVVKSHEGDCVATFGMCIVTSPSQKVGTWCMNKSSFEKNYDQKLKSFSVDEDFLKSLNGIWAWRGDGFRGDLWQRKSQDIIMFKTNVDIKGIDCGWAVLDASAGDWIEIVDNGLGAPRNEASVSRDFKKKFIVDVNVPQHYFDVLDKHKKEKIGV